jgi:ligand-binding sensor domain-containing protein/anti-sigma regulatory factor (Ser/Thr protein kinase)
MNRRSLSALLLLLPLQPILALDPNKTLTQDIHRIWQLQQGLSDATIYAIRQTRDGYLWLGTQSGLVRFDGVRFTSFEGSNGVSMSGIWIRNLLEDAQGDLWAGTIDAGLFRIRNGNVTRYSRQQGLPSDTVGCLVSARNGGLWACTPLGLVKIAPGKLTVYRTAQGLATDSVRSVCETRDGSLWAGGESSTLSRFQGNQFVSYPLHSISSSATVRALLCARDGALWIGTTDGLVRLENGREQRFSVADGLADNSILELAESRDGVVWIGAKNGFSRIRNGEFESFRSQDGLSQSAVYALFEDHEGALWVGTKHGLNQFMDGRGTPFTAREGLPSNEAGPVLQDRNGRIWVGTLDAGLSKYEGHRFTVLTTKQGLASNSIRALAEDSDGDLWIGTSAGLNRLHGGRVTATYTTAQGLPANGILCLLRDHSGVLWIGTASGAAIFRNGVFSRPPGFSGPLLAIGQDRSQRHFVAGQGGALSVYGNGKLTELTAEGTPVRDVDAFYEDREGLLWIGTLGGGIRLLKDGKLSPFYVRDGLFDNEIYGIASDNQDRFWIACSKGIFSVLRSDLLKFAAGTIQKLVSAPYSPLDGLRTIESRSGVQPSVWKMRDGSLWFATIRGLMVLDPVRMQRKLPPPPVAIEEVTVNGQAELPSEITSLSPGRKNIEFSYTGLSYILPARITFRYILEGFDKNWIDAGTRREAFYTNLPPGNFRFRVTGCNIGGTCNEAGSAVSFSIAPFFYQRIWFIPFCAALAALAGWLTYKLRIRRLKERFDVILGERSRIARELHDTLIQGFSGVTMEMQALFARVRNPDEKDTLQEIIHDAAACLRDARRSVAGLRGATDANSGLSAAIAQTARQITETKDVRLRLNLDQGPQGLPADVEYNLLRIAQEAVSNSVKHSGARNIEVALQCTAESTRLQIADDGAGFDETPRSGHYGLIGMRERATHIGADFSVESGLTEGTMVCVILKGRK